MQPWSGIRVSVVSGSYGAGHDVVAHELTARLRHLGARVSSHDVAGLLSFRAGQLLRWTYPRQLRVAPTTWGTTLPRLDADTAATRTCRSALRVLGSRLLQQ